MLELGDTRAARLRRKAAQRSRDRNGGSATVVMYVDADDILADRTVTGPPITPNRALERAATAPVTLPAVTPIRPDDAA